MPHFVLEDKKLHHRKCQDNNYLLYDYHSSGSTSNICCQYLSMMKNTTLKALLERASKSDIHLGPINNRFLNFHQLDHRIKHSRDSLQKSKLSSLNIVRKVAKMAKTLELHKRLMILIKDNNIPQLHHILTIAMKNHRSVNYIIGKIGDAIDGLYRCNYSETDKDIAFLVLQYGGPALLHILHRSLHFPSHSTIYRMLKSKQEINTALDIEFDAIVPQNFCPSVQTNLPARGYMLKIDDTYLNANIRWNTADNKMYGVCYEHGRSVNMNFNTYDDIHNIKQLYDDGLLHIPNSCQVTIISNNAKDAKGLPVLVMPTCSRSDTLQQRKMIVAISEGMVKNHGFPLLNWGTDGDGTRRIIFNAMSKYEVQPSSLIYPIVSSCRLLDQTAGKYEETTNFDAKHQIKRFRNHVIGENFRIGDTRFNQTDVCKLLKAAETGTFSKSVDTLVQVSDKQNVPYATELSLRFIKVCSCSDSIKKLGPKFGYRETELQLLSLVVQGILAQYCYVDNTISELLKIVSAAAHALFVLYKVTAGQILTHQLYHDLQSTFQDIMFVAAKWKVYYPDDPCYIVLLGTDVLERFLGNTRLKFKHSSYDALEFIKSLRSIALQNDILTKHPEWMKNAKHIMKRLALDYSSIASWKEDDQKLRGVNIVACWNLGRTKVETIILDSKYSSFDFLQEFSADVTMLCPMRSGVDVGVSNRN